MNLATQQDTEPVLDKDFCLKFVASLKTLGMVVVDEAYLLELSIKANIATAVDTRVKWLTIKQVMERYNVTRYWIKKNQKDPNSLLKFNCGNGGKTSKIKILESSVVLEQKRNAI